MTKEIRWGILAPGVIAHKFVQGLAVLPDAKAVAVGSRSKERAEAFAQQYGIEKAYGSYEELAQDPDIDIIYVASPHPRHYENTLLCLKAGKAVLCEKPFTVNSRQTENLIHCARENKLFLMEAMWTRYLPVIVKVREWLSEGAIGDVRQLRADFGFRLSPRDPKGRILNPELGGGALLDLGIYTTSFTSMVFGRQPSTISSQVHIGPTGVDEQFGVIFGYEDGKQAILASSVQAQLLNGAWIMGTEGSIHIPEFFSARQATLVRQGKPDEHYEPAYEGTGYNYEAAEAMRCLREGALESVVMPLDETLAIMKTLDDIRTQWGLKYPGE